MSSLNEVCGDGRFISPPDKNLMDIMDERCAIEPNSDECKDLEDDAQKRRGTVLCRGGFQQISWHQVHGDN